MSETKHTPGPWRAGYENENTRKTEMIVRAEQVDGQPYVAVCLSNFGDMPIEANARLIAAAPDLLAIAELVVASCEDTFFDINDMSPEWTAIYNDAKAAVAKAKGQ